MSQPNGHALAIFLRGSLDGGHSAFQDLRGRVARHSDQRIDVGLMHEFRDSWSQLVVDDILREPAGRVAVISYSHAVAVDLTIPIKTALKKRGADVPACGLTHCGEVLAGDGRTRRRRWVRTSGPRLSTASRSA